MPLAIALLLALCTPAHGAEVEKNEHGVVILARPETEEGERVAIVPTTIPGIENHWVVHPDAIRECNAQVAELTPYVEATTKLEDLVAECDDQRQEEAVACNRTANDLVACTGSLKECRRERWRAFFMGGAGGAAVATVIFIVLAL